MSPKQPRQLPVDQHIAKATELRRAHARQLLVLQQQQEREVQAAYQKAAAALRVPYAVAAATIAAALPRGSGAKFTPAQVQTIRAAVRSGQSCRAVAAEYGCSAMTISRIVRGVVYGGVHG